MGDEMDASIYRASVAMRHPGPFKNIDWVIKRLRLLYTFAYTDQL